MIYNNLMEKILIDLPVDSIQPQDGCLIWKGSNQLGQPFWGVGDFGGLPKEVVKGDVDLMALEWDGNEVYLSNLPDVPNLMIYAIGIIKSWKRQMEKNYADVPFDIFLSVDNGDEDVFPSITLRFWAIREQEHFIIPSTLELEKFLQPILMEQVNYSLSD